MVQFYFHLDTLRREIDGITTEFGQKQDLIVRGRLKLVAARLKKCAAAASKALEKLDVPGSEEIDDAAALAHENIGKSGQSLRDGLRNPGQLALTLKLGSKSPKGETIVD